MIVQKLRNIQLMSQGFESQKQDFKTYLERTGAVDEITKAMVKLFEQPQKPSQTLNYLLQFMGVPESENVDTLLKQFQAQQLQNIRLRAQISKVQKQIEEQKGL